MRYRLSLLAFSLAAVATAPAGFGQLPASPATAATAATVVPLLVRYAGYAPHFDGKAAEAAITFRIFKDEQAGEPLWTETQPATIDNKGRYEVHLGATQASGLPADLFASGEARWLEVQVSGSTPQARVLLASVPYAMKASDAATLGGLPASAFVLAGTAPAALVAQPPGIAPDAGTAVTSTGGVAGHLPVYTSASTIDDSVLFESGTKVGIGTSSPAVTLDVNGAADVRGPLTLTNSSEATSSAGANSHSLDFTASTFNSSSKAAQNATFALQAETSGNDTTAPGATLNLLYGLAATPAETGFRISSKGLLTFATGQTFPSTTTSGNAISGTSTSGDGVVGTSTSGDGVLGDTAGSTAGTAGVLGVAGARNTDGFSGIAGVWGDASAHVGVLGTSNQYAGIEGVSGTGQGVLGQSTSNFGVQGISASGNGVAGSSTTANGVLGTTAGATLGTAGVFGVAGPRTSFGGIAAVWGDSASRVGVYGSSTTYSGVYGASAAGNGIQGSSVNAPAGAFTSAGLGATLFASNSGYGGGVSVTTVGTNSEAIYANAGGSGAGGSGGIGVTGYVTGTPDGANPSIGVYGSGSSNGAGFKTYGVVGSAAVAGVGVLGIANAPSISGQNFDEAGVWADTDLDGNTGTISGLLSTADDTAAAYMVNNSNMWDTMNVLNSAEGSRGPNISGVLRAAGATGSSCGIGTEGDLTCTGLVKTLSATSKARMVETYAMQAAESWMEDFGSAALRKGSARVTIDAAFAETANTTTGYQVFLTARGDSMGLYVSNVTATGFEVHEAAGGTSSLPFEYRIVARRRGYESQRLNDVTDRFNAEAAHAHAMPASHGSPHNLIPRAPGAGPVGLQPSSHPVTTALRDSH